MDGSWLPKLTEPQPARTGIGGIACWEAGLQSVAVMFYLVGCIAVVLPYPKIFGLPRRFVDGISMCLRDSIGKGLV